MESIDVEGIFRKCTVGELRQIEKEVKSDIERKKEELRQMVGRRYRDIIDAADNINEMRVSSEKILSSIRSIQTSVDRLPHVQHKLIYAGEKSVSGSLSYDEAGSAVMLSKCVADILQLAYDSLDSHNPLESAWCFMIADYLYRTWVLKYSNVSSGAAKWFLEKEFADAGKWRHTIIRSANTIISDCTNSMEITLDAICAIAILERTGFEKVVDQFVACRMDALRDSFKNSDNTSREQIVQCLLIFQKTLIQLCQLFLPSEDGSRVLDRIRSLVSSRWNPGSMAAYTKYQTRLIVVGTLENLDYSKIFMSSSLIDAKSSRVCELAKNWSKEAFEFSSAKLSQLLHYFDTIDSLTSVKQNIVTSLTEHSESYEWKSACQKLFGEDLSLWRSLCAGSLSERLKQIIQQNVHDAFTAVTLVIASDFQEEGNEKSTAGQTRDHFKSLGFSSLELAARGLSYQVYCPVERLNSAIAAIDSTLSNFLSSTTGPTSGFDSKWSFGFDEGDMRATLGAHCLAATERLLLQMDESGQKWQEKMMKNKEDNKKPLQNLVSLAKLAQCLCDFTAAIKKCILEMQSVKTESSNVTSNDRWTSLRAAMMDRAGKLYKVWMKFIASDVTTTFRQHLLLATDNVGYWLDHAREWEGIQIEEETEEGQKVASKILIPATCSRYVLEPIHAISRRLIEVGAQSIPSDALVDLHQYLRLAMLESFEAILLDNENQTSESRPKLRQQQAILLLFDINVSAQMLQLARGGRTEKETSDIPGRVQRLTDHLESYVDPFDLDVMKPYMKINVQRLLHRLQALYQPLYTADTLRSSKPPQRSSSGGSEVAQLLPLATCQNRFHLLPIAAPSDQYTEKGTAMKNQRQSTTVQGRSHEQGIHKVDDARSAVLGAKTSFASSFYDKLSSGWFGSN